MCFSPPARGVQGGTVVIFYSQAQTLFTYVLYVPQINQTSQIAKILPQFNSETQSLLASVTAALSCWEEPQCLLLFPLDLRSPCRAFPRNVVLWAPVQVVFSERYYFTRLSDVSNCQQINSRIRVGIHLIQCHRWTQISWCTLRWHLTL